MFRYRSPQTLSESFGLALFVLRISGFFPYQYSKETKKFKISYPLYMLTIAHICIYSYVNITMLMHNAEDYSQPLIGFSGLAVIGNLTLRLLGIVITFLALGPVIFGSKTFIATVNLSRMLMERYQIMGINVECIYRRLYWLVAGMTLAIAIILGFSSWHSIYFYEVILREAPTFKYYAVVALSYYYRSLFLFNTWLQLFTIYEMSQQLNVYLLNLMIGYKERFERERMRASNKLQLSWLECELIGVKQ